VVPYAAYCEMPVPSTGIPGEPDRPESNHTTPYNVFVRDRLREGQTSCGEGTALGLLSVPIGVRPRNEGLFLGVLDFAGFGTN
jgi:hypothetical protein